MDEDEMMFSMMMEEQDNMTDRIADLYEQLVALSIEQEQNIEDCAVTIVGRIAALSKQITDLEEAS